LSSPQQQIVISLKAKPKTFGHAEVPRQPQVGVRRDGTLAKYDFVDPPRRDANRPSEAILESAPSAR
jgi:hypothetical protein